MHKSELLELSQRLAQLADALGGRAPTQAGLLVWGDALSECRFDDVKAALSDWPKKNRVLPVPADILKVCRTEASQRLEQEAERQRRETPTLAAALSGAGRHNPDSPIAKAALAAVWEILKKPKPAPKDWARKLKAREEAGEELDFHQRKMWREALQSKTVETEEE